MNTQTEGKKDLVVTVEGVTHELSFEQLGLDPKSNDETIKQRLDTYFDGQFDLSGHEVTREPTGVVLVKSSPIYG